MEKTFFEYELAGKKINLHKDARVLVQIGRNKDSYRTNADFPAEDFSKALSHYEAIQCQGGGKKRLVCKTLTKPVLARVITH